MSAIGALLIAIVLASANAVQADDAGFKSQVRPLLDQYCIKCHGSKTQKGDRRFDRLTNAVENDNQLVDFQDVLDQLNLGEMPPEDASQPTIDERRAAIEWITKRIAAYHIQRKSSGGQPVLRRLNSREYHNTVRDLFRLNMTMFQPTAAFPRDQTTHHLDNVGESLVTSGHLLVRYLEAAEAVVDRAMLPLEKPKVQTWTFTDGFRQQPEIDQVHKKTNRFTHITLYDVPGADKPEGAYAPILPFAEGVPHDGYYDIKMNVEALNRINPYDAKFLGRTPEDPLQLEVVAGNYRVGDLHKKQPIEPVLAHIELEDGKKSYTVRVWLDQGYTPRFTFPNGQMDMRNLYSRILKKHPNLFPKPPRKGIVGNRLVVLRDGKLPQIRIDDIEIKGPIFDQWPTASQKAVFGDDWNGTDAPQLSDEHIEANLRSVMTMAYRRPVTDPEIQRIKSTIDVQQQKGRTRLQAYRDGLQAVLCSPNFLYFEQGQVPPSDTNGTQQQSASALATRLSYFLWASQPDEQLTQLAVSGELRNHDVLRQQVDRMLDDPKSDAFVKGFLASWLTLRELGATPPDRGQFNQFYRFDLGSAMREETRLFTRHLIEKNLSIVNFLDSDFTFANKALARLYDIQPPSQPGFHKVQLTDPRRGGLLGQASVLTVTANGFDTSPVVRGVWLLENILGTPPSPPPPDVEPLDPDVRGAKTIRDQLNKHRDVPSCFACHRKIDPLGFALENFGPIGEWRNYYDLKARTRVDPGGELPGGKAFKDIAGLKQILVAEKSQFAKALTEKLLAYAIGRTVNPVDRPHVDAIQQSLAKNGWGFRDLIHDVVQSEPFRNW